MYGEENVHVANCYQIIANTYQSFEQFRKALEYQEKAHEILSKLYPAEDPRVKNSLATIDQFTKLSVQKEIIQKSIKQTQRPLGSNKKPKQKKGFIPFTYPNIMTKQQYLNFARWFNMANTLGGQQPGDQPAQPTDQPAPQEEAKPEEPAPTDEQK